MGDGFTTIREVDPANAEAILTLRLSIPDVVAGSEDEYYLARAMPPRFVVGSRTVNPGGSVTETGTMEGGSVVAHCTRADGRAADGRGCGYGKTVCIVGRSAGAVAVRLSMYWTDRRGRRGRLDEELVVPWLGAAQRESAGGRVEARITRVGARAEPGAAADPRPRAGGGR